MEKDARYKNGIYGILIISSAVLLLWENFYSSWLWLFAFLIFTFVTLLNDFLLEENHWWSPCLTVVQYAGVLLLAALWPGYGSLPLVFVVQMGSTSRYGRRVSTVISLAFFVLLICALYLAPDSIMTTAYPAVFLVVCALTFQLFLFFEKDFALLRQDYLEQITRLQYNRKELRDLNRRMEDYSEEMEKMTILRERSRMSKQIHDTLGHVLTAVSVQLEAAELLFEKNPAETLAKIGNAKIQTREGLQSIKQALSLIDEDSIQFEEKLYDMVKKAGTAMDCKVLPQISIKGTVSLPVQEFILSSLKEGITNGVRHGGASAFVFRFDSSGNGLSFYLEDNGRGCAKINRGYGLTAMEKQAQEFGGAMEIHSVEQEGFVLTISIPERRTAS